MACGESPAPFFSFPLFHCGISSDHKCSGRAYSPRLMFMWPNAKIGVMGSEQLSAVMEAVGRSADPALKARIDHESEAIFSSARLWDDGVIPPAQTRKMLGLGLAAALNGKAEPDIQTKFGVFRM